MESYFRLYYDCATDAVAAKSVLLWLNENMFKFDCIMGVCTMCDAHAFSRYRQVIENLVHGY